MNDKLSLATPKLQINWKPPKISEETGEYFENQFTMDWLKGKNIEFKTESELETMFSKYGNLEDTTAEQLKKSENLSLTPSDFEGDMEEENYEESFKKMESSLLNDGEITLPAPIVLYIDGTYFGFAGNRRMNLAFKYGLPLKVWMVRFGNIEKIF